MINVNKVVVSNEKPCNSEKDWWYILGYHVDGEMIMILFIKTPKNIFSYGKRTVEVLGLQVDYTCYKEKN